MNIHKIFKKPTIYNHNKKRTCEQVNTELIKYLHALYVEPKSIRQRGRFPLLVMLKNSILFSTPV